MANWCNPFHQVFGHIFSYFMGDADKCFAQMKIWKKKKVVGSGRLRPHFWDNGNDPRAEADYMVTIAEVVCWTSIVMAHRQASLGASESYGSVSRSCSAEWLAPFHSRRLVTLSHDYSPGTGCVTANAKSQSFAAQEAVAELQVIPSVTEFPANFRWSARLKKKKWGRRRRGWGKQGEGSQRCAFVSSF